MSLRALTRVYLQAVCAGTTLLAQVPSHATVLNPTGALYGAALARAGDTIHACGIAGPPLSLGFVHYARSQDGGRTWPVREVPLAYTGEFNGIAAADDLVVVLVKSRFFGPFTMTSVDGGGSWALPVRVSQQSAPAGLAGAALHVSGTTVNVAWYEDRAGGRLWFNQSTDGGATWRPVDHALDGGLPGGGQPASSYGVHLFGDGAGLGAVWVHWDGSGVSTVSQRSPDGGTTWQPVPTTISNDQLERAVGDGGLLVVSGFQSTDVWRSLDGGASWSLLAGHGLQDPSVAAVDDATVMLLGYVAAMPSTVEANVSLDGGATWLPVPYTLQTPWFASARPHVAGDNQFVQLRFLTNGFPPSGTAYHSGDGGVSWRQLPGEAGGELWAFPDSLLVTTRTTSTGNLVHAYVLTGHTTLGSGTPGTGGLVPRLAGSGLPVLGGSFAFDVEDARAGALGVLCFSFAPPGAMPLGTAVLYVQPPVIQARLTTSASGAATFPVSLPASPAFAGLTMTSQAFVLDPGALDGFTATRAIRTWIN